jgi:3-hydroxyisobutyrate dehydrogenase
MAGPAVAVLGAGGTMGFGLARNIARAGLELLAWNRSREKAEPLAGDGARICDSPAEAVAGADVVVTMLTDAAAALATMRDAGALDAARAGCVWAQMGTIGEDGTARCVELAAERGVVYVDAPVLGTKQPAAEGKLVVLASGPDGARERVQPVFDAVGQRTMWLGAAGAGTRLKLVTNAWIVACVEGLGLDGRLFFEAIEGGALDMPYVDSKGAAMVERNFEPTFALKHATKDANLAVAAADRRGLDLPVLAAIAERMEQAVPEHGDEDLSVTFLTSAPAAAHSPG